MWQSTDPILEQVLQDHSSLGRLPKKLSLYTFTQLNPIRLVDPDGKDEADAFKLLSSQKNVIIRAANDAGIPPLLLGAVLYQEQKQLAPLAPLESYTDAIKADLGFNASLGPGQIKINTAADVQGIKA